MATIKLSHALALGQSHLLAGRLVETEAVCRAVLAVEPEDAEAHRLLGLVAYYRLDFPQAVSLLERAAELRPDWAVCSDNLSFVLKAAGRFEEAEAAARRALAVAPDEPGALCNLAAALQAEGQLEEAGGYFRRALAAAPDQPVIRSCALVCEQYRPGVTPEELAAAHAEWDRRHGAALEAAWRPHRNVPDPDRPLRLGFVSPDFGAHPVGYFLAGVLENLDRRAWHTLCYSDRLKIDEMTERLEAAAGTWRDVRGVSDEDLTERIRADRVDILFDLAGHTAGNRLPVFARKPAPIQVTWLGYVGTTGLSAIDYLLADRHQVAEGTERYYREKVLRMPEGYVCYQPPPEAPEVGPLPAAASGRVTLASFNNPAKINPAVAAVWAEILRQVPGSRLILKYCGYCAPKTHRRFLEMFASRGIGPAQLDLQDWSARRDLLAVYNEVDLALDPFPYSGGLTTCESLWMGVPVITCPGQTFGSRHSLSHLSSVGLTGTVARDLDDYVGLAVGWSKDLPRLASVRSGLRAQMSNSALCDVRRFAVDFAGVLRGVWSQWCRR